MCHPQTTMIDLPFEDISVLRTSPALLLFLALASPRLASPRLASLISHCGVPLAWLL
jgi:hypothetical protein